MSSYVMIFFFVNSCKYRNEWCYISRLWLLVGVTLCFPWHLCMWAPWLMSQYHIDTLLSRLKKWLQVHKWHTSIPQDASTILTKTTITEPWPWHWPGFWGILYCDRPSFGKLLPPIFSDTKFDIITPRTIPLCLVFMTLKQIWIGRTRKLLFYNNKPQLSKQCTIKS